MLKYWALLGDDVMGFVYACCYRPPPPAHVEQDFLKVGVPSGSKYHTVIGKTELENMDPDEAGNLDSQKQAELEHMDPEEADKLDSQEPGHFSESSAVGTRWTLIGVAMFAVGCLMAATLEMARSTRKGRIT